MGIRPEGISIRGKQVKVAFSILKEIIKASNSMFKLREMEILINNCQSDPIHKYTLVNLSLHITVEEIQYTIRERIGNPNIIVKTVIKNKLSDNCKNK